MENASKALIMAAGVLIGILTISLMVYLFNRLGQSNKLIYNQIQEREVQEFNSKLLQGGGEDLTSKNTGSYASTTELMAALAFIRDINLNQNYPSTNDEPFIQVKVTGTPSIGESIRFNDYKELFINRDSNGKYGIDKLLNILTVESSKKDKTTKDTNGVIQSEITRPVIKINSNKLKLDESGRIRNIEYIVSFVKIERSDV